jgi:hypothetical protein
MDGSSQVERNHLGQTQLAVLQGWYNVRGRHHNLNPSSSREAGSFFGQLQPWWKCGLGLGRVVSARTIRWAVNSTILRSCILKGYTDGLFPLKRPGAISLRNVENRPIDADSR